MQPFSFEPVPPFPARRAGRGRTIVLLLVLGLGAIAAAGIFLFRAPGGPSLSPLALEIPPPEWIVQEPVPALAYESARLLAEADRLPRDYSEREGWIDDAFAGMLMPSQPDRSSFGPPYALGDGRPFYTERDTEVGRWVSWAELVAVTEHAYFWGVQVLNRDQSDVYLIVAPAEVQAAADRFEAEYYPRVVDLFGTEWQPGIDDDPRFHVLHLEVLEGNFSGKFGRRDEYPLSRVPYSNEMELVYLNMSRLTVGEPHYFGTLIHEFNHLVSWYRDPNEERWLREGLAEFAKTYAGLEDMVRVSDYLARPGISLTQWRDDEDVFNAHYGGAHLFITYLGEQLGVEAVVDLLNAPANGLASVAAVLSRFAPRRPLADFFADWAVANLLDGESGDPRYSYSGLRLGPPQYEATVADAAKLLPELAPYGIHHVRLAGPGTVDISFAGDTLIKVTPPLQPGGDRFWFAPPADASQARLTRAFDLSQLDAATLNFWTWYDVDVKRGDLVAVTVSADGGETWQLENLRWGRSADEADSTGGWVLATVNLDSYAGQRVLIRFEFLTEITEPGAGFAVGSIAIPELDYEASAERGASGWQAEGFVRMGRHLPQSWELRLVEFGATPRVTALDLNELNQGRWVAALGPDGGALVIAAVSPAGQPANCGLDVRPAAGE
jgi:hypothetical protein